MFADIALHLHRLWSRHRITLERLDRGRVENAAGYFVRTLPKVLGAEACNIFVYDPVTDRAWVEAGTGLSAHALAVPAQRSVVGSVIVSGRARIVDDPATLGCDDAGLGSEGDSAKRNAAYAPVRSRFHDEVIGVIEVCDKTANGGRFLPADLETLEAAAEILQDLVDREFLAQGVYGATDAVVAGGRRAASTVVGLAVVGAILVLLLAAWSALPAMHGAFSPLMPPIAAPGG